MCTITQQWYMRPAVYCLLLCIGNPNENHDDTEQVSDTINLVLIDGYRRRTDDVVRATCIRGVRDTAVCVISSTEYTRSIFDREYYCNNTAAPGMYCCTSVYQ